MTYDPLHPFHRESISQSAGLSRSRRLETLLNEDFATLREAAIAPMPAGHLIYRITEGPDDALVTHFPRVGLLDIELMKLPRENSETTVASLSPRAAV